MKGSKVAPNNPNSYTRPSNVWLLSSGLGKTKSLEEHIIRLIEFIESRDIEFGKIIRDIEFGKIINDCEVDIFCGCFLENFTVCLNLSPETLKRITVLPVRLFVNHDYFVGQTNLLVHNGICDVVWKKVMTSKEVIKILKKAGFEVVEQTGSHVKLKLPGSGNYVTVPTMSQNRGGRLS